MIIHVSLAFAEFKDHPLASFALGVHDGLSDNSTIFTKPPPTATLPMLLTAIDTYNTKLVAAHQGSVASTTEKNVAREELLALLRILAAYVESVALGDASIIEAGGFDVVAHVYSAQTPLAKPVIIGIRNLITTELKVDVASVPNMSAIETQTRTGSATWQAAGTYPNVREIVLKALMPGTMYDVRVRGIGGSIGYSDWSDAVSHMCT